MKSIIAVRKLYYSIKGISNLSEFTIKISMPYHANEFDKNDQPSQDCYACDISIEGINEPGFTVYGMDSVQAINIATNLEPFIKRLSKKYDIYWVDHEPYFDE